MRSPASLKALLVTCNSPFHLCTRTRMMHFASDITQWAPRQLKESMMRPLTVIMITIMIMTTMIMKLTHLIRISPILSSPSLTSRSCPYSGNYIKFGITQTAAFMWNQNLSFSSLQNATNCGRKGLKGGPSINFHVVGGEWDASVAIIIFASVIGSVGSSRSFVLFDRYFPL